MKRSFIAFQYAPKQKGGAQAVTPETNVNVDNSAADSGEGTPAEGDKQADEPAKKAEEPTSEKLLDIRKKLDAALDELPTITDRPKKLEIVVAIQKMQQEETAEIANIKRAIIQAEIEQKRSARIALADNFENALRDELAFFFGTYKDAPEVEVEGIMRKPQDLVDAMNALSDKTKAAREVVVNELIAKFASSTPASGSTSSANASGSRGETSKKIIEKWEANRAAGMSDTDNVKDIIAKGFSRGTTGAVTLAWRREKGEVKE